MRTVAGVVFRMQESVRKAFHKVFREPVMKAAMASCGKNVHIAEACDIKGIENITIGSGSSIGRGAVLWTTRAKIMIGRKVMFGPNVTVITGNHRTDMIGKYMADVTDAEKRPEDDADVMICDDVWIGANVTVLKGVTVAEGCVISAGAVVTRSTQPYGIYGGVPAVKIRDRFSTEELSSHIKRMRESSQRSLERDSGEKYET